MRPRDSLEITTLDHRTHSVRVTGVTGKAIHGVAAAPLSTGHGWEATEVQEFSLDEILRVERHEFDGTKTATNTVIGVGMATMAVGALPIAIAVGLVALFTEIRKP